MTVEHNPLARHGLRTRAEVEDACRGLLAVVDERRSPGGARVSFGTGGATFPPAHAELEGFARPLYALVPLAMSGASWPNYAAVLRGIESGTDPGSQEYWGAAAADQRLVEMSSLGIALAFAPDAFFFPLSATARSRFVRWLHAIFDHRLPDNNWHLFRLMVAIGLSRVGQLSSTGRARCAESLEAIESHYAGDGYYHDGIDADGSPGAVDFYLPWAYHSLGLAYAQSSEADAAAALRFRARAREFAPSFQRWFDADGRALAYGRSQGYRFAQAALFGAFAFAGEEALPWARMKGLYLRNLRYWSTLPIVRQDGALSQGYGYDCPAVCEPYLSPSSPYWCMTAFLPLALPETHPFWAASEEPAGAFEVSLESVAAEPRARRVLQRGGRDVLALNAGQYESTYPNGAARYAKLAYSSRFGFSVAVAENESEHAVFDSMLALREPGGVWRVRRRSLDARVEDDWVSFRWHPAPGVVVRTALLACGYPWHLRVHLISTERALESFESAFALGRDPEQDADEVRVSSGGTRASCASHWGAVTIADLRAEAASMRAAVRQASVQEAWPNTHLLWPRTRIPRLGARLSPGRWLLASAVAAGERRDAGFDAPPPSLEVPSRLWNALAPGARGALRLGLSE